MEHLRLETDDRGVARLTLDRPDVRNAFNAEVIAELHEAADTLASDGVRAVVLSGAGPSFSAGADLGWMRSLRDRSRDENLADAQRMAAAFRALNDLPCVVIGRVHGHAMGGGVGLVSICDVVVAAADTVFALSEVRLGITPAVISPFVVRKIGPSHARALFVTGERFDAAWAEHIGLVHYAVETDELDATVASVVDQVLRVGPRAASEAKRLPELARLPLDEALDAAARQTADLRVGDEGQEGMSAFLDKRRPAWAPADG